MIRLLILSCLVVSVFPQGSGFFESLPAILNAQAGLANAYYGNLGRQSSPSISNQGNVGGIPGVSSTGFPDNVFPFNNPAIQNYIQRTLNTALNTASQYNSVNPSLYAVNRSPYAVNPSPYTVNPSPYAVNPSPYVVNPQNNNVNYVPNPPNRPAPASRRPSIKYPGIKNSLNNANSDLKNIGGPGGGGLNFPFSSFFGR